MIYVDLQGPAGSSFAQLDGMPTGDRAHRYATLPKFVVDTSCPRVVVASFLGGLLGGDDITTTSCVVHEKIGNAFARASQTPGVASASFS